MSALDKNLDYRDIDKHNGQYYVHNGLETYGPFDTKAEAKEEVDRRKSAAKKDDKDGGFLPF